ncbi:MAG: hypothetical protein RMN51_00820 [Verrucomicrobiota bacterium]|nr:hypothetical protein [Limisphaera sp.]MDW8380643.1 hypothetical protein [Verrucomicrobiota bacterium]
MPAKRYRYRGMLCNRLALPTGLVAVAVGFPADMAGGAGGGAVELPMLGCA